MQLKHLQKTSAKLIICLFPPQCVNFDGKITLRELFIYLMISILA